VVLLKNTVTQMVYKHAISTVGTGTSGRDARTTLPNHDAET
jgi:sRNA-binding regulator protein Hfq